jgi:hypothetical protein
VTDLSAELMLVGALPLAAVLDHLSADKPIFHSESDFQHSLAGIVGKLAPAVRVELEWRPMADRRWRIDLSLVDGTSRERVLVELKYATRRLAANVGGERYEVKDHAAQDITRHDFIKDVLRLETLVNSGVADRGLAILLTNDQGYWKHSARQTIDTDFRLHDTRMLTGTMAWTATASAGTRAGRDEPLTLSGRYTLGWHDYSRLGDSPAMRFRFLPVHVGGPSKTTTSTSPQPPELQPVAIPPNADTTPDIAQLRRMVEELRALRLSREPVALRSARSQVGSPGVSGRSASNGRDGSQRVPSRVSCRRRAIADNASSTTRLARAAVMSAWS